MEGKAGAFKAVEAKKHHTGAKALDGVDPEGYRGEMLAICGANGAGGRAQGPPIAAYRESPNRAVTRLEPDMPPRSPLPRRHGLDAAWVRTPDRGRESPGWATLGDFLVAKLLPLGTAGVAEMLAAGSFVDAEGRPMSGAERYRPHTFIWFHRVLRDEPEVPFDYGVLHRDERIVVFDKPHFLSTIPRGRHVTQSLLVRARADLGLPELAPAHRLDRQTAGVVMFTTQRRWRASYQTMFQRREPAKSYRAVAPMRADLELPTTVRSHIVKGRGTLQAREMPGAEPNAETRVELLSVSGEHGHYALTPTTGKTHQLRLHLNSLGIPIVGDPLYPRVLPVSIDDFTDPMQLLAATLSFVDPVDGTARHFASRRSLPT